MTINPNNDGNLGFQSLLYVNFIIRKKYRIDEVAKEMRIASDTLYRYARGENVMPPDRIIDLVKATGDSEYLEFFCEPCGFHAVPASKGKVTPQDVEKDLLHIPTLIGKIYEEWRAALPDGIDPKEKARLDKVFSRAISKLEETRGKINAEA